MPYTLNITYDGRSTDVEIGDRNLTDEDVRRTGVELVRAGYGDLPTIPALPANAFDLFVVDRFEYRIYLRPKVPFGA